ncbi:MAG: PAS domain S-box protein [Candidatus Sulfobium sp.]|jgi:PAS domain S-box-containing protein
MENPLRVLIIEDSEDDVLLLLRALKSGGYDVHYERVDTADTMEEALARSKWGIVISDYIMPRFSGIEALKLFKKKGLDIPFIIVSGKIGEDIAVEAMRSGAHDYIIKGHLSRLAPAVERELREMETRRSRRLAERALRESEVKMAAITAAATDAIVMIDSGGIISYWNPAAVRIFGYTEEAALGQPLVDLLVPAQYRQSFSAGMAKFLRNGRGPIIGNTIELRSLKKDGSEFPVEVSLSSVKMQKQWHAVGIIRDITDRKRQEEELWRHRNDLEGLVEERTAELIRTNQKLEREIADRKIAEKSLWTAITKVEEERAKSEAIIAAMGDGISIQDGNFKILYQNRIHKDLMGDHVGEYCYRAYAGLDAVCAECHMEAAFREGTVLTVEKFVTTAMRPAYLEITVSPLREAGGGIAAGIEIVRDITGRKKMEEELREHRDHLDFLVKERTAELRKVNRDLRAEIMRRIQMEKDLIESQRFVRRITDATPNLLYLYDVIENQIVYINPLVNDLLGYSPDEVRKMGSSFYKTVLHPEDFEDYRAFRERVSLARDGDVTEHEYRMRTKREEWRWFYSRDVVFKRTNDGILKLILGIAEDVTEKKKAADEIKRSREQLRKLFAHAQSVREEERTRISREIHDELGQALTALKMDLSWIIKRLDRSQETLHRKARDMSKLIDMNIQAVKRISSELRPGLLDVLGLTAALEWQIKEFHQRTGIKCKLRVTPPEISPDKEMSTTIFRIFQETLTNVARHAGAGRVTVRLERKAGDLVLQVKDDGCGITDRQISSPTSIGLMGMKERANFLGGRIGIKGERDKGTTVTVVFPFSDTEGLTQ